MQNEPQKPAAQNVDASKPADDVEQMKKRLAAYEAKEKADLAAAQQARDEADAKLKSENAPVKLRAVLPVRVGEDKMFAEGTEFEVDKKTAEALCKPKPGQYAFAGVREKGEKVERHMYQKAVRVG